MTTFAAVRVTVRDSPAKWELIPDGWLWRAGAVAADFWRDMSGGRERVQWRVHGDVELKMSQEEKQRLSAAELVNAIRAAAEADGRPFAAGEHLLAVMNDPGSGIGICVTDPILRALDVDVAVITHEMGHFFQHAAGQPGSHANWFPGFRVLPYDDRTCIMGREGAKFSFKDPSLTLPGFPGHDDVGPGMSPPMTSQTGWLDLTDPNVAVDVTHRLPVQVELKTWRGAPPPGYQGLPVVIVGEGFVPDGGRVYLSLRSPSAPWDAAFPVVPDVLPNPPGSGMVVAQELTPAGGSLLLTNCAAVPRTSMRLGRAPLRVDVIDLTGDGAIVRVTHDPWRAWQPLRSPELHRGARVAAVARYDAIDAFVVARDGIAYHALFQGGVWRDWDPLDQAAFSPTAGIAAASPGPDVVDVFVVGSDDQLRRRRRQGGTWAAWQVVDGGNLDQDSSLAATSTGPDTVLLVASDRDGRVVHTTLTDGIRDDWAVLPEVNRARGVAVNPVIDGVLQVHAVSEGSPDARLWTIDRTHGTWDGAWTAHVPETFPASAGIAAISPAPGSTLVAAAANPMLLRSYRTGSWQTQWTFVDGLQMSDTSSIAAVSRDPGTVDVIALGADAQLHAISRSLDPGTIPATRQVLASYPAAFMSHNDQFVSAQPDGTILADRNQIGPWETFTILVLKDTNDDGVNLTAVQAHTGRYLSAHNGGGSWLLANRHEIRDWELFTMTAPPDKPGLVTVQALGGHLWCAERGGGSWVTCSRIDIGPWEQFQLVKLGE